MISIAETFSIPTRTSEDMAAPCVNPLRRIGRNDPCPCGSGKKYRNAALAP